MITYIALAIVFILLVAAEYLSRPHYMIAMHLPDATNPGLDWSKLKEGMKVQVMGKKRKLIRVDYPSRTVWYKT
jgi:hypothetical protein